MWLNIPLNVWCIEWYLLYINLNLWSSMNATWIYQLSCSIKKQLMYYDKLYFNIKFEYFFMDWKFNITYKKITVNINKIVEK